MPDREELIRSWSDAATSGSLLTAKHDPNGVVAPAASYRSVLTHQMSASLESFVQSGRYVIRQYHDSQYPKGAGYFEVAPDPASGFSVVGSGVPSGSMAPTGSLDRLVFVSGSNQGWHVYAESTSDIAAMVAAGRLRLSGSL
ncbi:MAG: hypothetical protein J0L92_38330 [Deltaproteobacteria bacterium]|nr:hypothetical protein [Deltaproteobacteria bacterium]